MQKTTTSYLQVVCLTEGVRTDHQDILSLVKFHRGDIRRCILSLQFWVNSGASPRFNPLVNDKKSSCVFINTKEMVDEQKETSCLQSQSTILQESDNLPSASNYTDSSFAQSNLPDTCCGCLPSFSALKVESSKDLLECLRAENVDLVSNIVVAFKTLGLRVIYNNLLQLLPLTLSAGSKDYLRLSEESWKQLVPKRKWGRIQDYCDSDDSGDGFVTLDGGEKKQDSESEPKEHCEANSIHIEQKTLSTDVGEQLEQGVDDGRNVAAEEIKQKKQSFKALCSFSELFDNFVFTDLYFPVPERGDGAKCTWSCTEQCIQTPKDGNYLNSHDIRLDLAAAVEISSVMCCSTDLKKLLNETSDGATMSDLTLPICRLPNPEAIQLSGLCEMYDFLFEKSVAVVLYIIDIYIYKFLNSLFTAINLFEMINLKYPLSVKSKLHLLVRM